MRVAELRPFQTEALQKLDQPGHVICVSPTGSGKSTIYEELALQGHRVLLVTPLVALARQQVTRLEALGIDASSDERRVWVASPEKLRERSANERLRRFSPTLLVVDECHCLWEWGESFRPAFEAVPGLLQTFSIQRSLWLTATLPARAREDLKRRLANHPGTVYELGRFDVPSQLSLSFERTAWHSRLDRMLAIVRARSGKSGVIFTSTRESTERLARVLSSMQIKAHAYHAGLSHEERMSLERSVRERTTEVLVATSAFGMGMDVPSLSWALLWHAPSSPLSLAQMLGRVGRHSQGDATVLWDEDDFRLIEWTAKNSEERKSELLAVREILGSNGCRRASLRSWFEKEPITVRTGPCDKCDVCQGNSLKLS